jgi:hypothetical protein
VLNACRPISIPFSSAWYREDMRPVDRIRTGRLVLNLSFLIRPELREKPSGVIDFEHQSEYHAHQDSLRLLQIIEEQWRIVNKGIYGGGCLGEDR